MRVGSECRAGQGGSGLVSHSTLMIGCCEATVGKLHPSYAGTVHNMANVYEVKGEYDRALEMYEEARAVYEVHSDPNTCMRL